MSFVLVTILYTAHPDKRKKVYTVGQILAKQVANCKKTPKIHHFFFFFVAKKRKTLNLSRFVTREETL